MQEEMHSRIRGFTFRLKFIEEFKKLDYWFEFSRNYDPFKLSILEKMKNLQERVERIKRDRDKITSI